MIHRDDCCSAVSRERFRVEVRHRVVVVVGVEVTELFGINHLKGVRCIFHNVVKSYLDEVIAIDMTVNVVIAQSMNELVHDNAALEAAVLAQRNRLHTTDFPEIAPASSAVEDVNVIN